MVKCNFEEKEFCNDTRLKWVKQVYARERETDETRKRALLLFSMAQKPRFSWVSQAPGFSVYRLINIHTYEHIHYPGYFIHPYEGWNVFSKETRVHTYVFYLHIFYYHCKCLAGKVTFVSGRCGESESHASGVTVREASSSSRYLPWYVFTRQQKNWKKILLEADSY